jgi:hypothetical protein
MRFNSETLEKISDLGIPKGFDEFEYKRKFKYRVSFKAVVGDSGKPQECSFSYYDLASARRCYRKVLLALYRGKGIASFAICLNPFDLKKWEGAIHRESVDNVQ